MEASKLSMTNLLDWVESQTRETYSEPSTVTGDNHSNSTHKYSITIDDDLLTGQGPPLFNDLWIDLDDLEKIQTFITGPTLTNILKTTSKRDHANLKWCFGEKI